MMLNNLLLLFEASAFFTRKGIHHEFLSNQKRLVPNYEVSVEPTSLLTHCLTSVLPMTPLVRLLVG